MFFLCSRQNTANHVTARGNSMQSQIIVCDLPGNVQPARQCWEEQVLKVMRRNASPFATLPGKLHVMIVIETNVRRTCSHHVKNSRAKSFKHHSYPSVTDGYGLVVETFWCVFFYQDWHWNFAQKPQPLQTAWGQSPKSHVRTDQ